jgi:hypothetical protein
VKIALPDPTARRDLFSKVALQSHHLNPRMQLQLQLQPFIYQPPIKRGGFRIRLPSECKVILRRFCHFADSKDFSRE